MRKNIKVKRERGRTIVIYSDAPKAAPPKQRMPAKPFLVRYYGRPWYYIMPDGSITYPRVSIWGRLIRMCRWIASL